MQSPFTAAEVEALREFARKEAFVGLVYDPLAAPDAEIAPQPEHFAVLLPQITLNVTWRMGANGSNGFYLASDMMTPDDAPPGQSLHADFFDAWEPEFMETLVSQCLNQRKDCGVRALGDGYALIDP